MNRWSGMNLKTRALLATGSILLVVLGVNTSINIYYSTSKYREALVGRTAALAEGIKKDIDKALGFGLTLNSLQGMSEQLRELTEREKDIAYAMVMDIDGRVLYAGNPAAENTLRDDAPTKRALGAAEPLVQSFSDAGGSYHEQVIPLVNPENKPVGAFRIALRASAVNRQMRSLLVLSLIVGIVSFIAATVFVSLVMGRSITRPISEMSMAAARVASGDLSRGIMVEGHGEIASLGTAVNTMSSSLRGMLGRLRQTMASLSDAIGLITSVTQKMSNGAKVQQEATEQTANTVQEMVASIQGVAENAAEMSSSSTDASSSVIEMAASIEEVGKSAGALSDAVEGAAASIGEMLASIRHVSENAEALSTSAEQTSSAITEVSASVKEVEQRAVESAGLAEKVLQEASDRGMAAAAEAIQGMDNIKAAVEASAEVINRLGKRSQEIGQILKVIDEVTDQTGLLALNAAILAAQAGEHGKGFSVIAEEIKELAERTTASTQEIAGLIVTVQKEVGQSVQAMERGRSAVESGVDLVRVTRDVLEQVTDSSKQSADMARAIEKTTAEQARGIAQITEAVVSITNQIEHISRATQEQHRGSEQIMKAVETMRDITGRVKFAIQEQTTGSRQIAGAMETVTAQAAQIARSTSEQTEGTRHISAAVASIQKITENSVDMSIEIDIAMQTLRERAAALQAELAKFSL